MCKKYQHFLCPLRKTSETSHFCWLNFSQFFPTKLVVIFKIYAFRGIIFFQKPFMTFHRKFQKKFGKKFEFHLKKTFLTINSFNIYSKISSLVQSLSELYDLLQVFSKF